MQDATIWSCGAKAIPWDCGEALSHDTLLALRCGEVTMLFPGTSYPHIYCCAAA